MFRSSLLVLVALAAGSAAAIAQPSLNTARIEQLTGARGKLSDAVFKVTQPRSDLAVWAAGARITPALGLTSWAAFTRTGEQTVVMGDIVLTESQVNAALSAALDNGLDVIVHEDHNLPMVADILRHHPDATIDWVVEEGYVSLVRLNPHVRKVIPFALRRWRKGLGKPETRAEIRHFWRTLREEEYDYVFDTQGLLKTGAGRRGVGATRRAHGAASPCRRPILMILV